MQPSTDCLRHPCRPCAALFPILSTISRHERRTISRYGGGGSGSQTVSVGSCGHLNGRCVTQPGSCAFSNTSRVARRISRCSACSFTSPSALAMGNSIAAIRGIPVIFCSDQIELRTTVGIPFLSISRATRPAVNWHCGQTGIKMARSTPSTPIASAMATQLGSILRRSVP